MAEFIHGNDVSTIEKPDSLKISTDFFWKMLLCAINLCVTGNLLT